MMSDMEPRRVVIVAFDDAEPLDITGPWSVFSQANQLMGAERYRLAVAGPGDAVELEGGLVMSTVPTSSIRSPIHTLIVAGGAGFVDSGADERLIAEVGRLAALSERVASVCSGAFLLAAAGLLDGRTATTHWAVAGLLDELFPEVTVEPDRIFITDGGCWTSAGVTAGIDLSLAMVGEDEGTELAHDVARWLVLPLRRSGGQSQYGPRLAAGHSEGTALAPLLRWIDDHLMDDLSVAALAQRAGWSDRQLTRRFNDEVGETPARWIDARRVDEARRLLETTELSVAEVARRCGYSGREVLHRSFSRRMGVSPDRYRRTFAHGPAAVPTRSDANSQFECE